MFHYHKLMKKSLALLLLTGGYTSLVGQSVIDPSATNANYAAEKAALAAPSAVATPVRMLRSAASPMLMAEADATANSSYIPVDASYTAVPRNDDGSYGPVNLPFQFNLYGTNYSSLYINTNGNITFTGAFPTYSASGFPFSMPMVAPFWSDVDTQLGGQIYYKVTATEIIVTWNGVG